MAPCDADELGNLNCGGFLPERFTGDQHAVHDDGELAGDCDRGAFEAEPFSQLQPHLRRSHSDRLRVRMTVAAS